MPGPPPPTTGPLATVAALLLRRRAVPTPPARVGSPIGLFGMLLKRRFPAPVALLRADIRQAIEAFLLADPDITAIVGNRVVDLYVSEATKRPALTYHMVTQTRPRNLSGSDGAAIALFSFEAVTKDAGQAVAIVTAVNDLLDGLHNVALPVAGCLPIWVLSMSPFSDADDAEDMGDATGRPLMPITCQYNIKYRYQKKT